MTKQQTEYMQLKIELRNIEPMIWRRVVLPSRSSLSVLHRTIQASMGWRESHLHKFEKDGHAYGPDYAWDSDSGPALLSQNKQLKSLFNEPGEWLRYEYDFGDSWVHLIEFEHFIPESDTAMIPQCIEGRGNCPPEDCGGVQGYEHMLEVQANQAHEEHHSMKDWLGGIYDPAEFSVDESNKRLVARFS